MGGADAAFVDGGRTETRATPDAKRTSPPGERPSGTLARLVRLFTTLLRAHVLHARREAAGDRDRLVAGAVLAAFGALCVAMALALLHGVAAVALRAHGFSWLVALAIVAGADLLVGSLSLLAARSRFRKPVLPETRKLLGQTFDAMAN